MSNRREILLDEMQSLEEKGISCKDCNGKCCTFIANSMQTTPLETMEVYNWLKSEGRVDQELKAKLKKCIDDFRLDNEISTGKNSTFRRSYTCPFFMDRSLGCSIAPEVKPYGCLAFNPKVYGVTDGQHCDSRTDLLEDRDKRFAAQEELENERLKNDLGLYWDKYPFPVALLDIMERLDKRTP
jgi:Fe-S-cluster containining protein